MSPRTAAYVTAAGVAAVLAVLAGQTVAAPPKLAVSVSYDKRECAGAAPKATPVTAGWVELDRADAKPVRVTIEEDGSTPDRISVPGTGPVRATLVLQTGRVKVIEDGPAAQRIALGKKLPKKGRLSFAVPDRRNDVHGNVNVLVELERAARTAALAASRPLQPVRAIVGNLDTGYVRPDKIDVDDPDAWEAAILAHEYGHHVLDEIAPVSSPGGDHTLTVSYPNKPKIAWAEGFPTAFAAVVYPFLRGQLPEKCKPIMNLASTPATPELSSSEDRRYAQHNELRVAAVTHALMRRLGGGDLDRGLRQLLSGLSSYRREGHSVWVARDLRDLAVQVDETSAADHVAIDRIFGGQRIWWDQGFPVGVSPEGVSVLGDVRSADAEIVLRVTGPGGFDCRVKDKDLDGVPASKLDAGIVLGQKMADGGLGFSANDDCYLSSGNGKIGEPEEPHTMGDEGAWVPFPYLASKAHWNGEYVVRAKYVCAFDLRFGLPENFFCPGSLPVHVGVSNLGYTIFKPGARYSVTLPMGVDQQIATFTADGKCEVFTAAGRVDCGT